MGRKQKGQLAVSKEWAKHLRKFWRRQYWKMERRAGKNKIRKDRNEAIAARFYGWVLVCPVGLMWRRRWQKPLAKRK